MILTHYDVDSYNGEVFNQLLMIYYGVLFAILLVRYAPFFCSGVLPDTIQLSMFTGLPSMSWGVGEMNMQGASHQPNQYTHGHIGIRNHVLLICRRTSYHCRAMLPPILILAE